MTRDCWSKPVVTFDWRVRSRTVGKRFQARATRMTEIGSRRMLPRRAVLAALGAAALVASPAGWAQEGGNLQVVGEFGVTPDRADAVAAAAVKAGADVIFTAGSEWIRAAQHATKT